jgi:DUF971 family protein
MRPTSIKRSPEGGFAITWDDGATTHASAELLRDGCPCAECKGETVLLHSYAPAMQTALPGRYEITSIAPVGSYAIQITWGDGHATGLYTWEYLRSLTSTQS